MTTTDRKRFDPFIAFLVLACVGLAIVAFLLVRENRALKAKIDAVHKAAASSAE